MSTLPPAGGGGAAALSERKRARAHNDEMMVEEDDDDHGNNDDSNEVALMQPRSQRSRHYHLQAGNGDVQHFVERDGDDTYSETFLPAADDGALAALKASFVNPAARPWEEPGAMDVPRLQSHFWRDPASVVAAKAAEAERQAQLEAYLASPEGKQQIQHRLLSLTREDDERLALINGGGFGGDLYDEAQAQIVYTEDGDCQVYDDPYFGVGFDEEASTGSVLTLADEVILG